MYAEGRADCAVRDEFMDYRETEFGYNFVVVERGGDEPDFRVPTEFGE